MTERTPATPQPEDYSRLLNIRAMTTWTVDIEQTATEDLRVFLAALASIQAHLRSQHVEGDGRLSATWRSRRVERQLRSMIKGARMIAAGAENLRTAYASHVATMAALPEKREARQRKKVERRRSAAELTTRSLHRTASRAADTESETPEDTAAAEQTPAPAPARGIGELFKGA
jgi:hypothetical protein